MKGYTRRSVVVLAVVTMIAALLALPVTAGAATGDVEAPADWSACVGDATASAGFTDVAASSFAADAIDCIAYYDITKGTGTGTYSPSSVVTREQMALFLTRAAGPAGVALAASPADPGFTDDDSLSAESQLAIAQLYALGITKGTTATTYSPAAPVSRYQMALYLTRFLNAYDTDLIPYSGDDASGFTDLGAVTFDAFNAIEDAYDYGITTGTTATTFSPFAAVTREQMAAFITRALAFTNAAPAGVTLQAMPTSDDGGDPFDYRITVRDSSFMPVPFALVDTFYVTEEVGTAISPFATDGTCDADAISFDGDTECTIDLNDIEVDVDGNYESSDSLPAEGEYMKLWAWTGDLTDEFDADTTDSSMLEFTGLTPVDMDTKVSTLDDSLYLHFGDSATLTFQLIDENASDANLAEAGEDIVLLVETETWVDDSQVASSSNTVTLTTDASGKATYTVSKSDPDAADSEDPFVEDWEGVSISVTDAPGTLVDGDSWDLWFTDETPEMVDLTVSTSTDYVDNSGSTAAKVTVTATATDQYGDGFAGEPVTIYEENGVTTPAQSTKRLTSSSGKMSYTFTADTAGAGLEAYFDAEGDDYGWSDTDATFYFAVEASAGSDSGLVQVYDAANNLTVVDAIGAGEIVWVGYGSGDVLLEDGSAVTLSQFDTLIDDETYDSISWDNYGDVTSPITPATFDVYDAGA